MEIAVKRWLTAPECLAVVLLVQRQDAKVHIDRESLLHEFRVFGERVTKPGVGLRGILKCV
jgi:hypothetical protein